ncbi:MAG TPA: serine/threonine-protein kinase [Sandaracinaceae bacterium LLY-WYZ-13_1]|nr:serine/threonine-protein kinase [Sandaracinaceae bacterium LLY-WYZ-13_1]
MVDRIGNCRILGEIGSGGMAVVYRAVQEPLGREVAIKSLKPSIAVDSGFAKRFEREAHFMASLQHENILHVYDFIKDRGTMHIIMEYVQGIDLYDLLEVTPRLPIDIAAIIALQVARALDYAHFRGVIHRDIKPANVMISKHGEVKLMDFGIARDDKLSDLTETGTGLGTPSYMSPEQILGDKLDFRSDVFSLGIVLYQMCTGQKPFVEDDARTVMQKIRLDRYQSPKKVNPKVPRALERIMARCMEKMPANRYPTTQALIDDLMDFLSSRVPINHNARVVMYLRELGVVAEDEAEEILAASTPNRTRRATGDRSVLRSVWLVNALLFAGIVGTGCAIQAAAGRLSGDSDRFAAEAGTPVVPQRAGYLRFVVDPWAMVYIDGQHVLTTPSARRVALPPGRHWLKFQNEYYPEVNQEIWVREGETQLVEISLEEDADDPTEAPPSEPGTGVDDPEGGAE